MAVPNFFNVSPQLLSQLADSTKSPAAEPIVQNFLQNLRAEQELKYKAEQIAEVERANRAREQFQAEQLEVQDENADLDRAAQIKEWGERLQEMRLTRQQNKTTSDLDRAEQKASRLQQGEQFERQQASELYQFTTNLAKEYHFGGQDAAQGWARIRQNDEHFTSELGIKERTLTLQKEQLDEMKRSNASDEKIAEQRLRINEAQAALDQVKTMFDIHSTTAHQQLEQEKAKLSSELGWYNAWTDRLEVATKGTTMEDKLDNIKEGGSLMMNSTEPTQRVEGARVFLGRDDVENVLTIDGGVKVVFKGEEEEPRNITKEQYERLVVSAEAQYNGDLAKFNQQETSRRQNERINFQTLKSNFNLTSRAWADRVNLALKSVSREESESLAVIMQSMPKFEGLPDIGPMAFQAAGLINAVLGSGLGFNRQQAQDIVLSQMKVTDDPNSWLGGKLVDWSHVPQPDLMPQPSLTPTGSRATGVPSLTQDQIRKDISESDNIEAWLRTDSGKRHAAPYVKKMSPETLKTLTEDQLIKRLATQLTPTYNIYKTTQ